MRSIPSLKWQHFDCSAPGSIMYLLSLYLRSGFRCGCIQIVLEILDAVFKFAYSFPDASHELGDLVSTKKNKDHEAYEQYFLHTDSTKE